MAQPEDHDQFPAYEFPKPHPSRRSESMHLAMEAFDAIQEKKSAHKKNQYPTQGYSDQQRLSHHKGWFSAMTGWMKGMSNMERKHWLATASVAALAAIAIPTAVVLRIPDFGIRLQSAPGAVETGISGATDKKSSVDSSGLNEVRAENEPVKPDQQKVESYRQNIAQPVLKEEFAERRVASSERKDIAAVGKVAALQSLADVPAQRAPAAPSVAGNMMMAPMETDAVSVPGYQDFGRDKFSHETENAVKMVAEAPVSTFSIDVDTASYSFMRRQIMQGTLPAKDSVRIEEMVNYFPYDYPAARDADRPFAPSVAVYPSPWNPANQIVHIGIKGKDVNHKQRSNIVFLLDVSGSMDSPDKLPLLKNALRLLVDQLGDQDKVGIVVYAGAAGVVLEPTGDKSKILGALDNLSAGGSTAGGEGIRKAYDLARAHFDKDAVNRVILATDGDFNVGITNPDELQGYIERERESGIFLSVLGFGEGNYNDALMQKLAQNGNGTAAYIDNLNEARKVLVDEVTSSLYPIAKDVKIQVEFNPEKVSSYRLIGYETRMLNREDFNNDKVDAGEIGAGHAVTALYEITPAGGKAPVDALRYGKPEHDNKDTANPVRRSSGDELAYLKIRYKLPKEDSSRLIERPITSADKKTEITAASDDMRFAAAVAGFGSLLKGSAYTQHYSYDDVLTLAEGAKGSDKFGYRGEFVNLVRLAKQAAHIAAQPDR